MSVGARKLAHTVLPASTRWQRAVAAVAVMLKALSMRLHFEACYNGRARLRPLSILLGRWSMRVGRLSPAHPAQLFPPRSSDSVLVRRGRWPHILRALAMFRPAERHS